MFRTICKNFKNEAQTFNNFSDDEKDIEIVMSILSNYVPDCLVRAEVIVQLDDLNDDNSIDPEAFAKKFVQAVNIAEVEPYRAVTHNKGIMNGIDAVVLATGNDFRAVEAGVHAYASRSGTYSSLTHAKIENGIFYFWIEIPLALGTVGGLTGLHPLVKLSLELLHKPISKRTHGNCCCCWISSKFCSLKIINHHRNSRRTYENAFNEYFKSI